MRSSHHNKQWRFENATTVLDSQPTNLHTNRTPALLDTRANDMLLIFRALEVRRRGFLSEIRRRGCTKLSVMLTDEKWESF